MKSKKKTKSRRDGRELFAQAMTECAFSNTGCGRLPVRMIVEMSPGDPDGADAVIVLLCLEHSNDYKAEGRVISDQWLPTMQLDAETLMLSPTREERDTANRILSDGGPDALAQYFTENPPKY